MLATPSQDRFAALLIPNHSTSEKGMAVQNYLWH